MQPGALVACCFNLQQYLNLIGAHLGIPYGPTSVIRLVFEEKRVEEVALMDSSQSPAIGGSNDISILHAYAPACLRIDNNQAFHNPASSFDDARIKLTRPIFWSSHVR